MDGINMLMISKGEVWSVLNVLREIRDGAEPQDITQDLKENIELLEDILEKESYAKLI